MENDRQKSGNKIVIAGEYMRSRLEELLSDALGYTVELGKPQRRQTKREKLEKELARLEQRQLDRIHQGRTRGAGAGGFNRDIDNIVHQIRLVRRELECLEN